MTPEQLLLAEQVREDRDRGAIKPIEPNRYGLGLSKVLRGARDAMNWPGKIPKSVPLVGDMGLGDFVFGQGPEYAEDLAYGFGKGRGGGLQWRLDPRAVDLAGTPTFGAVGGAKLLAKQVRKGISGAVADTPINEGRRKALGKIGGLTAGAVTAAAVPDVVKRVLPGALDELAPAVGKEVAGAAVANVDNLVSQLGPKVLSGNRRYIDEEYWNIINDALSEEDLARLEGVWSYQDFPEDLKIKTEGAMKHEYDKAEYEVLKQLREDAEASIKEFGEVSPTYLEHSAGGIFTDPLPEGARLPESPHIRITSDGLDSETIGIVDDWLAATGRTEMDLRKMIVTGKFPEDFPDIEVPYYGFIRQWKDATDPGVVRIPEKPWKDE